MRQEGHNNNTTIITTTNNNDNNNNSKQQSHNNNNSNPDRTSTITTSTTSGVDATYNTTTTTAATVTATTISKTTACSKGGHVGLLKSSLPVTTVLLNNNTLCKNHSRNPNSTATSLFPVVTRGNNKASTQTSVHQGRTISTTSSRGQEEEEQEGAQPIIPNISNSDHLAADTVRGRLRVGKIHNHNLSNSNSSYEKPKSRATKGLHQQRGRSVSIGTTSSHTTGLRAAPTGNSSVNFLAQTKRHLLEPVSLKNPTAGIYHQESRGGCTGTQPEQCLKISLDSTVSINSTTTSSSILTPSSLKDWQVSSSLLDTQEKYPNSNNDSMHDSGDQCNVWVRHSLIRDVLNPRPVYGSMASNVSTVTVVAAAASASSSSTKNVHGSSSSSANANASTPGTPLRKTASFHNHTSSHSSLIALQKTPSFRKNSNGRSADNHATNDVHDDNSTVGTPNVSKSISNHPFFSLQQKTPSFRKSSNNTHGDDDKNSTTGTPSFSKNVSRYSSFSSQKSQSFRKNSNSFNSNDGMINGGTMANSMNDDASTSASTASSSGLTNMTTSAKWGWVKAFLMNNEAFTNAKNHESESSKNQASKEDEVNKVPVWRNQLKSKAATVLPETSSTKSPEVPHSSRIKTPAVISLKIIDLESEFHGQTVDIPISMIPGCQESSDSSSEGYNKSIFGDVIVMANSWPDFTSLPEKKCRQLAQSVTPAATPVSKWSVYGVQPQSRADENRQDGDNEMNANGSKIPSDLIHLTHLHEPAVVYCLRSRYAMNEIYTATGPILLALNPFKEVKNIYGDELMRRYCERGQGFMNGTLTKNKNGQDGSLPPHVYAVADNAYRAMMRALEDVSGDIELDSTSDQSILVSGESGAGKTVTTKIIMKYLAALSKRSNSKRAEKKHVQNRWGSRPPNYSSPSLQDMASSSPSNNTRGSNIEQQVLESNPILESFGNARTIRNDNSSRFGKFIEIKFTSSGKLVGASVDSYLLEKVRLINQAEGERNYHIFYELLSGASGAERKELLLGRYNPQDFNMTTSPSETYKRRDGVRDDTTFAALRKAMVTMGFDSSDQNDIFRIVSSLLHLSNITFTEDSSGCKLDSANPSLNPALQLLGVTSEALEQALCCVNIEAGGEKVVKKLFLDQSIKAKEALIKATYGALFTYLVQRINSCINGEDKQNQSDDDSQHPPAAAFIGVLDIFGFESFGKNSFEQLCINYCNESLQQQFNKFVFKLEQAEYEREGIQWDFISFPDNQYVLDLIDKKRTGVLNILDEQSFLTQCTDQSFAQLLYQKCGGGRSGKGSAFSANSRQMAHGIFSIHHYAGPVEYDTFGFLEKNKDELPKEIDDLLHSSENNFLRSLANVMSDSKSMDESSSNRLMFKQNSLKRITVGGQFSSQLQLLRKRIDATSPHYIRCLKPNDRLEPDNFDSAVIADQLRCAGILEAVRVSRVGYPQRYLHERFVQRYQVLALKELQLRRKDATSTFSTPVGFGFHGGFVPKNHKQTVTGRKSHTTVLSPQKSLSSEQECKILIAALTKQLLMAKEKNTTFNVDENIPPQNNTWVSPGKLKKSSKWSTPSPSPSYTPIISKKKQELDLMEIGIQMGKTKVFLRQHAFEALELMRGRIKSAAATILNSVFRMYLHRKRYVIMRNEYRARVAQRSRMIQEGGVVTESFFKETSNVSFDADDRFDFRQMQISIHREEDYRNSRDFKWVMVDNRWVRNEEMEKYGNE